MSQPRVGIVMGSDSDWRIMKFAAEQLQAFNIVHERKVVSAHRTPDYLYEYAETASKRGLACIIAGAGGAAHLPGMLAAKTQLPVLGVPIPSHHLGGLDSLLSIAQMPAGIPVATFAVGKPGARNAAIFAAEILAGHDTRIRNLLIRFRTTQRVKVRSLKLPSGKL